MSRHETMGPPPEPLVVKPAPSRVFVGTAGAALPAIARDRFPSEGSNLHRYAQRLPLVEINSTFYRRHKATTFERWRDEVPETFRFAVKLPKLITHEARLVNAAAPLDDFFGDVSGLGPKLGPVLVQLPPSLAFDEAVQERFWKLLRERFAGAVACEPRHQSFLARAADRLLVRHRVARVAADPASISGLAEPGGHLSLRYLRLHGSPVIYRSPYDAPRLRALNKYLDELPAGVEAFCVFDNTTFGAATLDALTIAAGRVTGLGAA